MSPTVATMLAAAESLSVAERRELIDLLAAGLDDLSPAETEQGPPALTEAWRRVVAERSAEYDAGRAETVLWQEVKEARREFAAGKCLPRTPEELMREILK